MKKWLKKLACWVKDAKKIKFLKLKIFLLFPALVLIIPVLVLAADKNTGTLMVMIGAVLNVIVAFLGWILSALINLVTNVFQYNDFLGSAVVQTGWPLVRDICNMFFVLVLLVISFGTILNIQNYHLKSALPKLLLAAILVNFSKTILGFCIDFAQIIMLTFVSAFKDALAINLTSSFGLTSLLDLNKSYDENVSDWSILVTLLTAIAVLIIAIGTMAAYAVVLLWRILTLWILIVLSPLAFFLGAIPGTASTKAGEFWKKFWDQLTTGVILAFFMWLTLSVLAQISLDANSSLSQQLLNPDTIAPTSDLVGPLGDSRAGDAKVDFAQDSWQMLYGFFVAIGLLMLALTFAQQAGGVAGEFAGKVSGIMSSAGSGLLTGKYGPGKRLRTTWEGYKKQKEQRYHEKYAGFGGKLAEWHGNIQAGIGQGIAKPFQLARKGIAKATGFDSYEKQVKELSNKRKALQQANQYRDMAAKIDKSISKGEVIGEDKIKIAEENKAKYLLEAKKIEEQAGLGEGIDLGQLKQEIEVKITNQENIISNSKMGISQLEEKLGDYDSPLNDQEREQAEQKINELTQRQKEAEQALQKFQVTKQQIDSGEYVDTSSSRLTEESLRQQEKELARTYLESKRGNVFAFTQTHWQNKSAVAARLAAIARSEGNDKEAEDLSKQSRKYANTSKLVGVGTTVAGAATLPYGGGAILVAKAASWFANSQITDGRKLSHMGREWKFNEVRRSMKEFEDLNQVELAEKMKDNSLTNIQQMGAILENFRRGYGDASQVEKYRIDLQALNADEKTSSYLEQLIQEQFPDVGKLKDTLPLDRQIELGIADSKKIDSSAFVARRGEIALAMAENLKMAEFIAMCKRSKAVEDNVVAGLEMALEDARKNGEFDDPAHWGRLSKVITRYFAVAKKDAKFDKLFINEDGETEHLGLLQSMSQNKDFQNILSYTRFDKLSNESKDDFIANVVLRSNIGEILPALIEAATNGDAPSQASAQQFINHIASLVKNPNNMIQLGLRGLKDQDKSKKEIILTSNFDNLVKSLREQGEARSGRMKTLFDWQSIIDAVPSQHP